MIIEYVAKEPKDTPHDATSVMDRNANTLFLSELFRGSLTHALVAAMINDQYIIYCDITMHNVSYCNFYILEGKFYS